MIFLIGITGILLQIVDFSAKFNKNDYQIVQLNKQLMGLKYKLFESEVKLEDYEMLKFKSFSLDRKYPEFSRIVETVYNKSQHYDFSPQLILGIIQVESSFNPKAVSSRGAYGLMQINHYVWKNELAINKDNIFNIDYNIDLGLKILQRYYDESRGDIGRALHLYNNGYKYNNVKYRVNVRQTPFLDSLDKAAGFK